MLFHRGIQVRDVSDVVFVMMEMHGCIVNVRFQGIVRIRQRGDFVSHFNHLSLSDRTEFLDDPILYRDARQHFSQNALKASSNSVFCSISCAACEPVDGLEEGERFTDRSGAPRVSRSTCGASELSAPMFAGSSATHQNSRPLPSC